MNDCTRCGAGLPSEMPREGVRHQVGIRRETTTYRLRLTRWRFRWLPEDPADQATASYTDLPLCHTCAGDVFLFAQGKERHRAR